MDFHHSWSKIPVPIVAYKALYPQASEPLSSTSPNTPLLLILVYAHQSPSVQFSSVQLLRCAWLSDPIDCSMPSLPARHQSPYWPSDVSSTFPALGFLLLLFCLVAELCSTLCETMDQAALSMGFPSQEYCRGLPFLSPALSNIWQQSRLNTGNRWGSKEGKESEQVINSKTTHWEEHVHNWAQFSSLIVKKSNMNYFCLREKSVS